MRKKNDRGEEFSVPRSYPKYFIDTLFFSHPFKKNKNKHPEMSEIEISRDIKREREREREREPEKC